MNIDEIIEEKKQKKFWWEKERDRDNLKGLEVYSRRGVLYLRIRFYPHGKHNADGSLKSPVVKRYGRLSKASWDIAKHDLAKIRLKMIAGKYEQEEKETRFSIAEACDVFWELYGKDHRNAKNFACYIKKVKEKLGNRYFDEICPTDVVQYRQQRANDPTYRCVARGKGRQELQMRPIAGKKVSLSTINKEHNFLVNVFNQIRDFKVEGKIKNVKLPAAVNPASMIKRPSEKHCRRKRVLTLEDFNSLLKACTPRLRWIVYTGIVTSLRQGDLRELTRDHYDPESRTLAGKQGKTGLDFEVYVADEGLHAYIMSKKPGEKLFDFTNYEHEWPDALIAVGMRLNTQFKDLRRSAASWALKKHSDIAAISSQLGHGSPATTQAYLGIVGEGKRDVARRLSETFQLPPEMLNETLPPPNPPSE